LGVFGSLIRKRYWETTLLYCYKMVLQKKSMFELFNVEDFIYDSNPSFPQKVKKANKGLEHPVFRRHLVKHK